MNIAESLRLLALDVNRRANKELTPLNMTFSQYMVLNDIATNPGTTTAVASRACGITPQTAWAIVANLIGNGHLKVTTTHGRAHYLVLTTRGVDALTRARAAVAKIDQHYTDVFDNEDIVTVINGIAETVKTPAGE